MKKTIAISITTLLAAGSLVLVPVVANAADGVSPSVAASRSFAAVSDRSSDLLVESSSVDVSGDSKWENTERLSVEQVKSPAEIEAEEAEKAAQEAAAQAVAAAQAQAASRSQARTSQNAASTAAAQSTVVANPGNASGAAIVALATQYQGVPYVYGGASPSGWDCSGFVSWVYSQFGISLPRTSGAQAAVGTPVASLAEAKPGDILANGVHAAIYIGDGMVVNALNPAQGTQITGVGVFSGGYSIRRVL